MIGDNNKMLSMNTEALRNKLQKEREDKENGNKKKKSDTRFLNYYDLEFGQEMVVRLLPDGSGSGDLYKEYETHGPNLKNPSIERISCVYKSSGERCPICYHSYQLNQSGDKEEAKRWRGKQTFISQCLVIDSPIEINESDDQNPVKLMYLPWGMKESIVDAILNGTISDPTEVNFVIKKTKNQGGFASYDKSYFKINDDRDIPDAFAEALEAGVAYLYDLNEEVPPVATVEESQEWLNNAIAVESGNTKTNNSGNDAGNDTDNDAGASTDSVKEASTDAASSGSGGKSSSQDLLAKLKNRNRG